MSIKHWICAGLEQRCPSLYWALHRAKLDPVRRQLLSEFLSFKALSEANDDRFVIHWRDRLLCPNDAVTHTPFDAHYVLHTAWAARKLAHRTPAYHIDFGSDIRFSTIVSAFLQTVAVDYRPARIKLHNFHPLAADLCKLPFADASLHSLSCMHVLEHVGLGRYGDRLDPLGDRKAAQELARITAPGGRLLLVVPVGRISKVHFNAHRVYNYTDALALFPGWTCISWALITDSGQLVEQPDSALCDQQEYGCGCYELLRPETL